MKVTFYLIVLLLIQGCPTASAMDPVGVGFDDTVPLRELLRPLFNELDFQIHLFTRWLLLLFKWRQFFSIYSTINKDIIMIFPLKVRRKIAEIQGDSMQMNLEHEDNTFFTYEHDQQLLLWMNRYRPHSFLWVSHNRVLLINYLNLLSLALPCVFFEEI